MYADPVTITLRSLGDGSDVRTDDGPVVCTDDGSVVRADDGSVTRTDDSPVVLGAQPPSHPVLCDDSIQALQCIIEEWRSRCSFCI